MRRQVTIQPCFDYKLLFKSLLCESNHTKTTLSNSGRTSLDICLKSIKKISKYKTILVPDLICSEIIPIMQKYKLNIIFYSIDHDLNPDLNIIEHHLKNKACILFLINYFGKASNWKSIFSLKKKYDFLTIEDNAHSLFGSYNGIDYGNLGDISFNSLRKIIPVLSGSVLQFNKYKIPNHDLKKRFLSLTELKNSLRGFKFYSKKELPGTNSHEQSIYDAILSIDSLSYKIYIYLQNKKEDISNQRKLNHNYWTNFLAHSDLEQIDISSADCPYAAPYIYNDIDICNKWLEWGRKNNINIIKWPSFPEIGSHHLKNKKFMNILLFPVNHMHDLTNINLKHAKT